MKHSCILWILSYSYSQLGWTNSKNFSVSSSNAQEAWTSYSTKVCKQLLLTVDCSHGRPFPSGPFYRDIDFAHYHVRPCLFATDLLNAHSLYSLLLDFCIYNPFTARPPFEIGFITVLSIFWLGKSLRAHIEALNAYCMRRSIQRFLDFALALRPACMWQYPSWVCRRARLVSRSASA